MTATARISRVLGFAMLAVLFASLVEGQAIDPHLAAGYRAADQRPSVPARRFATTRERPDAFGILQYTVTTVSAMSFLPSDDNDGYLTAQGALSRAFDGGAGELYASVSIPAGAIIDYIGLESYSYCAGVVGVELWEVGAGSTSGIATFSSSAHGYGFDINADVIGWQLPSNTSRALAIQVELSNDCVNWPFLSWVEIWWRRAVSPAPAFPTFNDVPMSDFGYQYIEALNASGITGGCATGSFCPDSPVSRRQMAIFLSKALGLHWPY